MDGNQANELVMYRLFYNSWLFIYEKIMDYITYRDVGKALPLIDWEERKRIFLLDWIEFLWNSLDLDFSSIRISHDLILHYLLNLTRFLQHLFYKAYFICVTLKESGEKFTTFTKFLSSFIFHTCKINHKRTT